MFLFFPLIEMNWQMSINSNLLGTLLNLFFEFHALGDSNKSNLKLARNLTLGTSRLCSNNNFSYSSLPVSSRKTSFKKVHINWSGNMQHITSVKQILSNRVLSGLISIILLRTETTRYLFKNYFNMHFL